MFFALVLTIIALIVFYFYRVYTQYSRAGINHLPICPGLGHIASAIMGKENIVLNLMRNFDAFPEDRFVGQFEFVAPMILVRDIELVKKMAVKDFAHFVDRRQMVGEVDILFGRNLLMLRGEEWKDKRSVLTPIFTSSKIRTMIPVMTEVSRPMIQLVKNKLAESENSYLDIELKTVTTRFSVDVINTCMFGLKVDCYSSGNEYYRMIEDFFNIDLIKGLKMFMYRCFPKIASLLKLTISSEASAKFFKDVLFSSIKNREEQGIIRDDLLQILMEARKDWSDVDLVSQAMMFLFAGVDTTSTTISFLAHELAVNPEVQDRLVQEIREHDAKGVPFNYESLQTMTYMDMVLSETLRLWTPVSIIDRLCVKDYNLGKPNKNAKGDYIIRRGECIAFPSFFIHRDPENFPDPYKFDPERFSEENKHKIKPGSYIPFGIGPRMCIGSRFALYVAKVLMYHFLKNFQILPNEKTTVPIELTTERLDLQIKDGIGIRIKARQ